MPPREGLPVVSPAFEAEALASLDSLYRTALRLTRSAGRRRGSGAGDLSEGVSSRRPLRAGDESEGLVVHDPPQHRPEPGPRSRARHGRRSTARPSSARPTRRPPAASAGAAETPEALLLRETLAPELQAAIDALPDAFRQAVWLRDVEEFSYAEIAEMLAIPVGTVMSRISRGRRMLFDRLEPLEASQCLTANSIDPLVTPFVDGELPDADRRLVDEHLRACPPCHARVARRAGGPRADSRAAPRR